MKTTVKTMLVAVAMMAVALTGNAQNNNRKQRMTREQLAEVQARHIAEKMAMDDNTSQKFMDTYAKCQKEIWALKSADRKPRTEAGQTVTEEQTGQAIKDKFAKQQKLLNIREKYYKEYSKFLSQKQIQRVYELEKQMMGRLAKGQKGKRPAGKSNVRKNR